LYSFKRNEERGGSKEKEEERERERERESESEEERTPFCRFFLSSSPELKRRKEKKKRSFGILHKSACSQLR